MSDAAYIQPSERERNRPSVDIQTGDRFPNDLGVASVLLLQAIESHAVVDSVAAELATALRPLLEIERYNLPQCTEADTGGCHYAKECVGGCGWETYCKARFDALHKEATNE